MNFRSSSGFIRPRVAILVAVAAGILIGVVMALNWPTGLAPQFVATSQDSSASERVSFDTGFASVVQAALPSVVTVTSTRVVRAEASEMPFFDDPFFQRFFGGQSQAPQERREQGLGSGVVVSADGLILTNNHVVEGASEVLVIFDESKEYRAKILGTDPATDIAVLKLSKADSLKPIALGDSKNVRIGEFVLAIGNPFGVGRTVTMGIVSATGRGELGITGYEDFIQTDAAINPGNSGGALIGEDGRLVGINTAILSRSSGNVGIGFAVPVNMARGVMDQIVKQGKVVRGYLGVNIQDLTPAIRKALNLSENRGALISGVEEGGPADKAGLERGDVVVSLNGEPVTNSRELRFKIAALAPESTARLEVMRDGRRREIAVPLTARPGEEQEGAPETPEEPESSSSVLGIQVQDLTPEIREQLQLGSAAQGALVVGVQPGSPAAEAGLARGDVIQEVNRKPVRNTRGLSSALSSASKDQPILLLVNRAGATTYVAIER
ncbi:MAG: DegQ family serine endoprotease [Acidobacteria bacterium]|nr:MAG: DegQ family serine endoprotease [Acidobacteriota bacterium]